MSDSTPREGPAGSTARIGEALSAAGYSQEGLRAAFGARPLAVLRRSLAFERRVEGDGELALWLRLFAAEQPVDAELARSRLGRPVVEALEACGMARPDGALLVPLVALEPFEELLIAFDLRERHRSRVADFVLGPGPGTQRLAELAVPLESGRLLDLGCGSGALALLAARRGAAATGADLSDRAIAFARFNAALNGLEGVELLVGDLFAPIAGRRFDRIVCNPPYVVSPSHTFTYRDGPAEVCARIAREAPAHLAAGGIVQMICNWPQRRDHDWRAELAVWFEGTGCDALVLVEEQADALDYAGLWLGQEHEADEAAVERGLDEWMAFYAREGIVAIGAGSVTMRPVDGRPPFVEVREAPPRRGPAGASLRGLLDARDRLLREPDDAALLELRLRAAPGLEQVVRRLPAEGGWKDESRELRLRTGYAFAARVDPVAAAIVGRLDGERTLREAGAAVAEQAGVPVGSLLPGLPELARRLMQLGLVG